MMRPISLKPLGSVGFIASIASRLSTLTLSTNQLMDTLLPTLGQMDHNGNVGSICFFFQNSPKNFDFRKNWESLINTFGDVCYNSFHLEHQALYHSSVLDTQPHEKPQLCMCKTPYTHSWILYRINKTKSGGRETLVNPETFSVTIILGLQTCALIGVLGTEPMPTVQLDMLP
jgi:hypothetical protein